MGDATKSVCAYRWSYPIIKYSIGAVRTCCRSFPNATISQEELKTLGTDAILNNSLLQTRRLEMLNGVRHSSCNSCWKLEDAGIQSPRTSVEDFVYHLQQNDPQASTFEAVLEKKDLFLKADRPVTVEIQIDNLCDLKCIYCNEEYSVRWEQEKLRDRQLQPSQAPSKNPAEPLFHDIFWKWFDQILPSLEYINFIGGEPSLSPKFYEIADRLLERAQKIPRKKIGLSIVSNFNASPERFTQFLKTCEKLNEHFYLSVDASSEALSEKGEYIRDGLQWSRFEKNAATFLDFAKKLNPARWFWQKYRQDRIRFGFQIANNALSVTSLQPYLQWAAELEQKHQFPIHLRQNVVSFPNHLSPLVLTKDFATYYFEAAQWIRKHHRSSFYYAPDATWNSYAHFLESLGKSLEKADPKVADLKMFLSWIQTNTLKRAQRFTDVFPEYSEFIGFCQNSTNKLKTLS